MKRGFLFTIRVSPDERQAIANLAACLQRSQSDAVRFVVVEAARQLVEPPAPPIPETNQGGMNVTG